MVSVPGRISVLGVDPGLNFVGYGLISVIPGDPDSIQLQRVGLIRPSWKGPPGSLDKVRAMMAGVAQFMEKTPVDPTICIIEFQQKYARDPSNAYINPNDLIKIGYTAAAMATLIGIDRSLLVYPKDWTLGRPKKEHQKRTVDMTKMPLEQWPWDAKETKTNQSHAIDGVGLAIWGSMQTFN